MKKTYLRELLLAYQQKRDRAERQLKNRKEDVYKAVPRIKAIDREISMTGVRISKMILLEPDKRDKAMKELESRVNALRQEKAIIMTENNIPLNYLEMEYDCTRCKDTGFTAENKPCNCLRQRMIDRAYQMSGLDHTLSQQNFSTFNINVFSDQPFDEEKLTPRENMQEILSICESYVHNFKHRQDNLLFYGNTGLGKTFLCNSVAKGLLDKGHIVVYQTAFRILEILEKRRFGKDKSDEVRDAYDLLFDAELLIIDDLGTEMTNAFSNLEIFNIINTRLVQNKPMIISTNLTPREIRNTYTERVSSRIFGNFTLLKFYGPDLRWQTKS